MTLRKEREKEEGNQAPDKSFYAASAALRPGPTLAPLHRPGHLGIRNRARSLASSGQWTTQQPQPNFSSRIYATERARLFDDRQDNRDPASILSRPNPLIPSPDAHPSDERILAFPPKLATTFSSNNCVPKGCLRVAGFFTSSSPLPAPPTQAPGSQRAPAPISTMAPSFVRNTQTPGSTLNPSFPNNQPVQDQDLQSNRSSPLAPPSPTQGETLRGAPRRTH